MLHIKKINFLLLLIGFIPVLLLNHSCKTVLKGTRPISLGDTPVNADSLKMDVVKQMQFVWTKYMQHAAGHDLLKPLSGSSSDIYREPYLATPIASYPALDLMGLSKERDECAQLILSRKDFNLDIEVAHAAFAQEVIGGLLAAYESSGDRRFLELARDAGNRLIKAYNSPMGIPFKNIHLRTGQGSGENCTPADIGGALLVYALLSKHSGDASYFHRAREGVKSMFNRKSKLNLIGTNMDIRSGIWTNPESTILEESADFWDAIYKTTLVNKDADLTVIYQTGMDGIIKYLKEMTGNGTWYEVANMHYGTQVNPYFSMYGCSLPGLLSSSGYLKESEPLMESVIKFWSEYGIAPYLMNYKTKQIMGASYLLQPDALHSAYMLYRNSTKERYLKAGEVMYKSIVKFCRGSEGFSDLRDVRTLEKMDEMSQSIAATFTCAYLLFDKNNATIMPGINYLVSSRGQLFKL